MPYKRLRGARKGAYRENSLNPSVPSVTKWSGIVTMWMPWGKYKVLPVEDVPLGHLGWVLEECSVDDWLRLSIRRELCRRLALFETQLPPIIHPPVDWASIIRAWHREMSRRFHPDVGGHVETMAALNYAATRLKEMVRL